MTINPKRYGCESAIDGLFSTLPGICFVECSHWEVTKTVSPHAHREMYQLDYFPKGRGTYIIDGKRHEIDSTRFFLVAPGGNHEIVSSPDNLLENLTVKFTHGELGRNFLPDVLRIPADHVGKISEQFRSVISAGVMDGSSQRMIASCRLSELLVQLRLALDCNDAPSQFPPLITGAKSYMHRHLSDSFKLSELAESLGVAGEYLCRIFKKHTGATPFDYLRRLRLARAKHLLEESNAAIASIAENAGFGTPIQMNRVFKKYLGTSPRVYRKNLPQRQPV